MNKLDETRAYNARDGYLALAGIALFCALLAVIFIFLREWGVALFLYGLATGSRLLAGYCMNQMGDAEAVNAWNNKYHRIVVTALNFGVGAVLLGMLWWRRWDYGSEWGNKWGYQEARWSLTIATALYLIAARFTRPNTFYARLRSAMLTVVLIGVLVHLSYPFLPMWRIILPAVAVLGIVRQRLRALQRRFGWADR